MSDCTSCCWCRNAFEGQLEYDLGNLAAFHPAPVDAEEFRSDPDGACLELASRITQSLVARIFQLPVEPSAVGPIAQLPAPTTQLPRSKPLPKPREPTRWEKFAQQKGIQKRKGTKLVYDEHNQEWRRRFGYNRASNKDSIPIVEAKAGDEVRASVRMHSKVLTAEHSLCYPLRATLVRLAC